MQNEDGKVVWGGGVAVNVGNFINEIKDPNAIEELELNDAFKEALGRDNASIKKEMGVEGFKELNKVVKKYENDPYLLNVKVQDMSDTLILIEE